MSETQPMREDELGRYVCVARGGCQHTPHITINADGVWVRYPDSLNPGSFVYSSAHRVCYAAGESVNRELFERTAPAWNCVAYPNDGMHYIPGRDCLWCGMTREQVNAEVRC